MSQKIILTGDRPSGKLHLGHYVGSLCSRVELQDKYMQYVMVADMQALTDNFETPGNIMTNTYELVKDYLAVGIDPQKTIIFIQSKVMELTEMTMYFMNLVNLGRLERNPTVKMEMQQKGFDKEIPVGFLCYPISQTSDIAAFKAELVPVGSDQLPILEQANEIIRKFNRTYKTDTLKEAEAYLSNMPKLMGIDGKAKASKSLNNAIFLADDAEAIKQKVFAMYTDPGHLKISDPGKVEGNVVFDYLDTFSSDKEMLAQLKAHYTKGGLGDSAIKQILNDCLQDFLAPIREKRLQIKESVIKDILVDGCKKASQAAAKTLEEMREVIGINYFK
jgi:tryptophanyl-tRNA synthetase